MKIGNHNIEKSKKVFIIAEIGMNHNGSLENAIKLIDQAVEIGADAVKFQMRDLKSLYTSSVIDGDNGDLGTEYTLNLLKRFELNEEQFSQIVEHSRLKKLIFLCTAWDKNSADKVNNLGVPVFKTASADIIDHSLHEYISKSKKPTIVSVGMASLGEIEDTLKIYDKNKNNELILLHCVSNYPCSNESLNMNVMNTLKHTFRFPVGFSDHSVGIEAAILSIALGSKVIEKHLTLDKSLLGPDHKASSTPDEFLSYVNSIRKSEQMMGDYTKKLQQEELGMSKVSRKSPVLNKDLLPGDILCINDIDLIRPAEGMKPYMSKYVIGKKARKHIKKGQSLSFFDFE